MELILAKMEDPLSYRLLANHDRSYLDSQPGPFEGETAEADAYKWAGENGHTIVSTETLTAKEPTEVERAPAPEPEQANEKSSYTFE